MFAVSCSWILIEELSSDRAPRSCGRIRLMVCLAEWKYVYHRDFNVAYCNSKAGSTTRLKIPSSHRILLNNKSA